MLGVFEAEDLEEAQAEVCEAIRVHYEINNCVKQLLAVDEPQRVFELRDAV